MPAAVAASKTVISLLSSSPTTGICFEPLSAMVQELTGTSFTPVWFQLKSNSSGIALDLTSFWILFKNVSLSSGKSVGSFLAALVALLVT